MPHRPSEPAPPRRAWGRVAATLVLTAAAAGLAVPAAGPAAAATDGSLLLEDAFDGASVANPAVLALNDACLTRATTAPPDDSSELGVCAKRAGAPATSVAPGFLQLTDASGSATGGIVVNSPLPASGGVVVTFDQYQYGGSAADGIGFFLTDGAVELAATGAPGGSLGYAQRKNGDVDEPGVAGGYLGVGLDAFGNFANDGENRGVGCGTGALPGTVVSPLGTTTDTKAPDAVVLRGPGSGQTGYCYLTRASAPVSLRSASTPTTAADIEALARTVQVTVSAAEEPLVTVAIDPDGRTGAAGMTDVLSHQMTTAAPATYKFGFLGSTGGQNDVHLVRNLVVRSAVPLAPLQLTKQVDRTSAPPAQYALGATVPYRYLVTNTEPTAVSGVVVSDGDDLVTCPRTTLGVAGSATAGMVCTGAHVLTEADFDGVTTYGTAASASGRYPDDTPVVSNESTATVVLAVRAAVSLAMTASLAGEETVAALGDVVTYDYTVRNSGNTPLSAVAVTPVTGGTPGCGTTLAVGAEGECSATHEVTQADLDAGTLHNAASAAATATGGQVTSPTVTADTAVSAADPQLTITGTSATVGGEAVPADTGDDVDYAFTLTNQGNVTLSAVALTLDGATETGVPDCADTDLAPGATTTCTAVHRVTSADVAAAEPLPVTGTGSATGPAATSGAAVTSGDATLTAPVAGIARGLGLTGVAELDDSDDDGRADPGEQVAYRYTVTNTGNVDLPAPTVSAPEAGPASCAPVATLAVGASRSCTAEHTVTQGDVDAGSPLRVSAVASSGTGDARVTSNDVDLDVLLPTAVPGLHVAVTADHTDPDGDDRADVGESVTITYTVTNTGNVSVDEVTVTDDLAGGAVDCTGTGSLAPGLQRTCELVHEVTQADVDAGRVHAEGTATGEAPDGITVRSLPTAVDVAAPEPEARIGLTLDAGIRSGRSAARLGDVIDYRFTVHNEGNVTLHAVQLAVTGVVTSARCPGDVFAPGRTLDCTASYRVTQQDIDDQVRLAVQGIAQGAPPVPAAPAVAGARRSGTVTAAALPATVVSGMVFALDPVVPAAPEVSLASAEADFPDADGDGRAVVGEQVTYRFTVENTGNTTLRDVGVVVTGFADPLTCTPRVLLPGETASCTASRPVTAADLAAGPSLLVDARPVATPPNGRLAVVAGTASTDLSRPDAPAAAADPETRGLAATGLEPARPLALGAVLLLTGAGLLLAGRRRRSHG